MVAFAAFAPHHDATHPNPRCSTVRNTNGIVEDEYIITQASIIAEKDMNPFFNEIVFTNNKIDLSFAFTDSDDDGLYLCVEELLGSNPDKKDSNVMADIWQCDRSK